MIEMQAERGRGSKTWPKRRVTAALAFGLLATTGVALFRPQGSAGAGTVVSPMTQLITIDSHVGETFGPPPSSAQPAMTADAAWAQYAQLNGSSVTVIPSSVTVSLGSLTLPVGPVGPNGSEVYTAYNELAYGFSSHSCPGTTLDVPQSSDNACTEWLFLDANTGQQIDDTWQQ